jgi:hypothetical protein
MDNVGVDIESGGGANLKFMKRKIITSIGFV